MKEMKEILILSSEEPEGPTRLHAIRVPIAMNLDYEFDLWKEQSLKKVKRWEAFHLWLYARGACNSQSEIFYAIY